MKWKLSRDWWIRRVRDGDEQDEIDRLLALAKTVKLDLPPMPTYVGHAGEVSTGPTPTSFTLTAACLHCQEVVNASMDKDIYYELKYKNPGGNVPLEWVCGGCGINNKAIF